MSERKADLFSGLLFCKDCNAQMTKKVDKRGKTPHYLLYLLPVQQRKRVQQAFNQTGRIKAKRT